MPAADQTDVGRIYRELTELQTVANRYGEPSDVTAFQAVAAKALIISAASYFERALGATIKRAAEDSGTKAIFSNFLSNQAIERKFHLMFQWSSNNVNSFFGLFGPVQKSAFAAEAAQRGLGGAISDFIFLGAQRNLMAHDNFAAYEVPVTMEEAWAKFISALDFVNWFEQALRHHAGLRAAEQRAPEEQ